MTEIEAKGFVQGKLDCMEKCDVFNKEDKHRNNECELCEYCYSQGNFGEQKEAFQIAINSLEELKAIKEKGRYVQGNKAGQKIGYRNAIDDLSNKICMHFADWKYSEDDKCIKDIIELASESVEEIAEQLKAGGKE